MRFRRVVVRKFQIKFGLHKKNDSQRFNLIYLAVWLCAKQTANSTHCVCFVFFFCLNNIVLACVAGKLIVSYREVWLSLRLPGRFSQSSDVQKFFNLIINAVDSGQLSFVSFDRTSY